MEDLFINLLGGGLTFFVITLSEYQLIGYVLHEKSKRSYTLAIYALLSSFFALVMYATVGWPIVVFLLFNAVVNTIPSVLVHRYIFKTIDSRIIFFLALISSIFCLVLSYWSQTIIAIIDNDISWVARALVTNIILFLSYSTVYYLLSKTKVFFVLRKVSDYPRLALIIALIVTVFNCVIEIINYAVLDVSFSMVRTILYTLSYGLVVVVYLFLLREFLRERRLQESEALILQQQTYLNRMEDIQLELRKIHHDYKNAATGLYAQMEKGDIDAAQEYISKKMLKLDEGIHLSMQQLNQLTNIEVVELKTLLMVKVVQAERQGVELAVEVFEPIQKIPMEISDLLRCGGILIDNAIEAAAKESNRKVVIVLLKENGKVTLLVKNSITQPVDLQRIWTTGYSTKGADRGLGLDNLKSIIRRYPDIWLETRVEKQEFIQMVTFTLA
ncbi:ATPase [Enterococcus florum]|uniref:ATPase n=1 Tax=Enterococcus florum TaxID=2480627 RepID=A0A4P5P7D5_9ENTE|nr:GHKL domain-containing protein [Enterococcus florum]GCF93376.1 ATPase [Enterococcus florum]